MQKVNKQILLLLLLVFTVFNTGIPVILHYCKSLNKMSVEQCSMCKAQHKSRGVNFSSFHSCCSNKLAASYNAENYLIIHPEKQLIHVTYAAPVSTLNIDLSSNENIYNYNTDTSPPFYSGQDLHIINSTFLI